MNKKLAAVIATTAVALTVSGSAVASAHDGLGGKDGKGVTSLLATLVTNGTITQSQADAIVKAAESARAANKATKNAGRAGIEAVVSSTLGISVDTIKSRMQSGETLATIAGSKKDALIAALTAEINKQIDAALTAGKLTSAQATAEKARTTDRVTNMINNLKPMGHKGFKGGSRA